MAHRQSLKLRPLKQTDWVRFPGGHPLNASVDKLVESPGFHPGYLPVQVRPEVPESIEFVDVLGRAPLRGT